jgi:two-component system phosphate regulon response regulator PhoB
VSRRILVADNDEQVRRGLQILLSNAGYTVLFAVDGISLIEQAVKHQPHLVMIDFCLPAGNASVLVQALRRFPEFTRMPIFVIGSKENRTSAGQVFDSGANAFLPKPFNRQVLFSMIARFLPTGDNVGAHIPVEVIDSAPKQPWPFSRNFID